MSKSSNRTIVVRSICVLMALAMSFCALFMAAIPTSAIEVNQNVKDAGNGLMQVRVVYTTDDGDRIQVQSGTGFLVNTNTLLTCSHVINLDYEVEMNLRAYLRNGYGYSFDKNKLSLDAVIASDITVAATIRKESVESDYAILTLTEAVYTRTPLVLAYSDKVSTTQTVYALGFPQDIWESMNQYRYTPQDVTITDGKISKSTSTMGVKLIQHSATITHGNSGGPLVDEDGNVVGINSFILNDEYPNAIGIDEVADIMDALGIEYKRSDSQPNPTEGSTNDSTEPTTAASPDTSALTATIGKAQDELKDESAYSKESIASLKKALENAENIQNNSVATQTDINKANADLNAALIALVPASSNTKLIAIVAIIALVVLLIVVVVIIALKGKKPPIEVKQPPVASNPPIPPVPPTPNVNVPVYPVGGTSFSNDGVGETSVLNDGAGETSVLGMQASALLIGPKNEKISINRAEYVIGKERRKVDYCIDNNSSISRMHAKIKMRSGDYFITDLNSTNGTFLNSSKLIPNQETKLSNGDKIKISDVEFEFRG